MKPTLHVCITCRAGAELAEGETPAGQHMLDAVAAHPEAAAVDVRQVKCLSVCNTGCAAAIAMPGKWTYLLGRLQPGLAGDLLAYAKAYATHPTGTVLPSRRPASLASMIMGRMPA